MLQLKKFSDIPVSTREEARGSRPHPEEPGFHLVARDEGFFSCFFWKEFQAFPSPLKRRRSQQERREKPQCPATIPRDPQMSQSISEELVFPALPLLSRRGFTHSTMACPTWDSPVGKPCRKASRESHRSLDPRDGKFDTAATVREESTCLPPHEMSTDSPGESPEVPQDPCQHWRGNLRFRPRLHTRS